MTQYALPSIDPLVTTGTELADYLNNWNPALISQHLGASRPSYILPGGIWIKETSPTLWEVMLYGGAVDSSIGTLNPTTGVFTVAGGGFPAGTRMLFQQTTPPAGWTKDTGAAFDDVGLRMTTGTVTNGGATAFSSVFGAGKNTGGYALVTADLPAHLHAVSITSGNQSASHTHSGTTASDGAHTHNVSAGATLSGSSATNIHTPGGATAPTSSSAGAHTHTFTTGSQSASHNHSVSGNTGNTGGGAAHLHSLALDLKFTSVIVASKD